MLRLIFNERLKFMKENLKQKKFFYLFLDIVLLVLNKRIEEKKL